MFSTAALVVLIPALPLAATLARATGAQVLLAHVVQRPHMPRRTPPSQEDSDLAARIVERKRTVDFRFAEFAPSSCLQQL